MKTETQSPSIAELWREFEKLAEKVAECEYRYPTQSERWICEMVKRLNEMRPRFDFIRKTLLERCKPWFGFCADGSIYNEVKIIRYPVTPEKLREAAAIHEFIAWEYEQRAKEREVQDAP